MTMRVLITGGCGFVGSTIAEWLRRGDSSISVCCVDNFSRQGSEINRERLSRFGVHVVEGDVRDAAMFRQLPDVDWVVEAAANPSVQAGIDGRTGPRELFDHNLVGTLDTLEYCRQRNAGLILLSTSRVYSVAALAGLQVKPAGRAFVLAEKSLGVTGAGISEVFSTEPPLSLYGASKRCAEIAALEYGAAFGFPVWINRCGLLAGPGQFGRQDQGIFAYWINAHLRRKSLHFCGFGGLGLQVRDCLDARDLLPLLRAQMADPTRPAPRTVHVSGGVDHARSLRELTDWCDERFGRHPVGVDLKERHFDAPWVVLDSALALQHWSWQPVISVEETFSAIAEHAENHPEWLALSGAGT